MATIILTGSCGDNATYNLYDDGLLEILGTGAMTDYQYSTSTYTTTAPWVKSRYDDFIKTITIADGITTIGDYAFFNCRSLTSLTIGNTVTSIGGGVLKENPALKSITIPSSVTTIKSNAFRNCLSLEKIIMLGAVPTASSPFLVGLPMYEGKGKILVPYKYIKEYKAAKTWKDYENLIQIGSGSLADLFTDIANSIRTKTGLTDKIIAYNFPEEIEKISSSLSIENNYSKIISTGEAVFTENVPQDAFNQSEIIKVTIRGGTEISDYAFQNCSFIKKVTIEDGVTYLGANAFEGCTGLTEITIPGSIDTIFNDAFNGCTNLNTVKFEKNSSITQYINSGAFANCPALEYLYLYQEDDVVFLEDTAAFDDDFITNGTVYVPASSIDIYKEDDYWSQFSNIEEISE